MLCPITRALDRVGDRWTLLVLRDLHAGAMRFGEVKAGLPGLASNLLTSRLDKLQQDGLVEHDGNLYALSDTGRQTQAVLWELARLGMRFPPDPEIKRPGHLRLVAVTLESAMRRVAPRDLEIVAELVLDGESFTVAASGGDLTVRYGAPEDPSVVAETSYEPMMLAAGGEMSLAKYRAEHVTLRGSRAAVKGFRDFMTLVMKKGFVEAEPNAR